MKRLRICISGAVLAAAVVPGLAAGQAEDWPSRSLTIVVPYSPGGSTDILARTIAEHLAGQFKQPVVVTNQPGAGGSIGTAAVARSAADGYTMVMATNGTHAINPSLYASLPYDAVKDFAPVSLVASVPLLLSVPASSTVKTLKDLVERYGDKKASLNFGSAGVGSSGHLAGEMLKMEAKLDATHVPYKGDAPAVVDLIGGQTDYLFANMPAAVAQAKGGAIRPLAVTTKERSPELPDVQTVQELGYPSLQVDPWYGILVPSGTDSAIVNKLSTAIQTAVKDPKVREKMTGLGATPIGTTPEQFKQTIEDDTQKFARVIKASGARID